MKQWEAQINRLIQETQARRAVVDRGFPKAMTMANNIQPPLGRHLIRSHDRNASNHSVYLGPQLIPYTVPGPGEISPYGSEENLQAPHHGGPYSGPQGYPSVDGFEFDEEEFDEPMTASSYAASGRGTPLGARRNNAMSMPPERDAIPGYDRPRAQTEDTNGFVMAQWRSNQGKMPPPLPQSAGMHNSAHRPITPRLISASSVSSFSSDASYVGTTRPSSRAGQLRNQFSSSKLRSGYDSGEARAKAPLTIPANPYPPPNRVRSASQPSTYHAHKQQQQQAPPLPAAPWVANGSTSTSKRGSGSSQSTGGSSEYSPNSSSPVTPFGSSESSLAAVGVRPSRSQNFESAVNAANQMPFSPPVKVKVHFHEDIFVIQVPRATDYADLVEKVGKKIRLCGPRREDGPLRVKYRDEDGDMISLGSTEDVQMAFESYKPGGQVTLFVT
jgi:cell division control protein 24